MGEVLTMNFRNSLVACTSLIALTASAAPAFAQDAASSAAGAGGAEEIIVTANKREQSINDVGVTIQAASAEALADRGISDVADLGKLVPGFVATQSTFATPVYTLRGIGLYDSTVGAAPAVAIYADQISRNFPMMSDALELDVERVEVLKGPQGTLFGQSSTGGAINYILGKPTGRFEAGLDLSYERFGKADIAGFISGPLSGTLNARLAVRGIEGGAWQYSQSRPDDKNGETRKIMGRLTLDWTPTETIRLQATVTGARDRSDTQAPQYAGSFYNIYSAASLAAANGDPATANPFGYADDALHALLTTPGSPGYRVDHVANQAIVARRMNGADTFNALRPAVAAGSAAILGTATAYGSNRAAEWTPNFLRGARNHYWQGTLRADVDLSDSITLTSVSAYAKSRIDRAIDLDGTTAESLNVRGYGSIEAFNQEFRLFGEAGRLYWIAGVNYDHLKTADNTDYIVYDYVGNDPLSGALSGLGPLQDFTNLFSTTLKTYAIFGNAEFKLSDKLTLTGGMRYTKNKQTAKYCHNDPDGVNLGANEIFATFSKLFGAPADFAVQPGECFALGDGTAGYPAGIATIDPVKLRQNEDNISFRAGVNYKLDGGGLLYATVSMGYKAGVFSNIAATTMAQYVPAGQEKLISYETGFKLPLAGNRLQLNGAFFYYDYSDKQTRAKVADPVFGLVERLINVPKSRIWGIEGEITARPADGLTLSASATYLDSKVTSSFSTANGQAVYNSMGFTGDMKGSELPYTPKFGANADIQYEWNMGGALRPFVGGTFVYQGKSNATFENPVIRADFFDIPSYKTVDLRAGVGAGDGSWKFTIYGRNLFDEYIITAPTFYHDAYFNMTGKPAVYGASLSLRY
ncbi:MAG: TonB-dependent receptor [Novosphingobium sp.]